MSREQLCGLATARHDVEQPVGNPCVLDRLRHQQRDLGPRRRGLDHYGVADGKRRRDLLDEQVGGPVERRDCRDHSVRHARREAEAAGTRRGHVEGQYFTGQMRHLRGAGAQEDANALCLERRGAPRLADETDQRAHQLGFDPVDGVCCGQQPFDACTVVAS
jgi:hypothetical protein